jgi:hypothetical protein
MHDDSITIVPSTADVERTLKMMGRYQGPPMHDVNGLTQLSSLLCQAKWTIPAQFRNAGDMLNLIMMASALDVAVPTALGNLIYSDTGIPTMRGRLALSLVMRAGHKVKILALTEREARIAIERNDGQPSGSANWTIGEAIGAGLTEKKRSPWANYATDMLFWRALSRTLRRFAADIMSGFYLAEEISDLEAGYVDSDHQTMPAASTEPTEDDLTSVVDRIMSGIVVMDETGIVCDPDGTPTIADSLTRAKLRTAWYEAGNTKSMDSVVMQTGDTHVTLRMMIEKIGEKYTAIVNARKEAAGAARVSVDTDDGMPISPDDQAPISTPSGSLACGCDADTVLVSGEHACSPAPVAGATK